MPRDCQLLRRLLVDGVLSSDQIHRFFFPGIRATTMHRRLRFLRRAKFVERFPGLEHGAHVWTVTPAGAAVFYEKIKRLRPHPAQFEHDVLVSEVHEVLTQMGVIEEYTSAFELRRSASQKDTQHQIPDALFTLMLTVSPLSVALEVEGWAKSKSRYRDMMEYYGSKPSIDALGFVVSRAALGKKILGCKPRYLPDRARAFLVFYVLEAELLAGQPMDIHFVFQHGEKHSLKRLCKDARDLGGKPPVYMPETFRSVCEQGADDEQPNASHKAHEMSEIPKLQDQAESQPAADNCGV